MRKAQKAKNSEKPVESAGVEKRPIGRPPVLTLEKVVEVGGLIAMGLTEDQACRASHVNPATFGPACCRNPEFRNALKNAQAIYLADSVKYIASGMPNWQGRAWLLERRHKAQFAKTENLPQAALPPNALPVEFLNSLAEAAQANPLLVPIRQKATANPTRN